MASSKIVSPNPWGDSRAGLALGRTKANPPPKPAAAGPSEQPPTEKQATRMRYNMAKGR
jgi:hypothetical protein